MPACRSGWEWRPTAATSEAMRGGPEKTLDVEQATAERATEPRAGEIGLSVPQPARQDSPGWQADAAARGSGRGTGAAEMEREA